MRFEIKRKLLVRSDRVKCLDFHPKEPWVISSLYNGQVFIWNHETQQLVKSFEVADVPVRACKFIARKNWFICGADDFTLRVYNYNTGEKITSFEAHPDYIRSLIIHPVHPYVLTSSDDMTIRCWNWEKDWKLVQTYEGHSHFVMCIALNNKDNNTFASACLDRTVKVWSLGSPVANLTLEAHEKGVNWVDYYSSGDRPYLVTTGDDNLIKVWDYQNKSCVQVLEGHTHNVSFAVFHPELPVIISGSEDGLIKVWHSTTYRLEETLDYGLERAWAVACQPGTNLIALGFDEGSTVVKLGNEDPVVSMDSNGKLVWAKVNEVHSALIRSSDDIPQEDGAPIHLNVKDLASCEVYPQFMSHSPNGRFVAICGDGEYIVYSALAWRNKAFGSALDFCWSADSNDYAVRSAGNKLRLYKNFKERSETLPTFSNVEQIFGGHLLAVKTNDSLLLFSWDRLTLIRKIIVDVRKIYWTEDGSKLTIVTPDDFYVLQYDSDKLTTGHYDDEEGCEEAFQVITEVHATVTSGIWVGGCFLYTTSHNQLNYLAGTHIYSVAHFDQSMSILGYVPKDGKIYLGDKYVNVVAYTFSANFIAYHTYILREDFDSAQQYFENLTKDEKSKVAKFLEDLDHKELALEISADPDHKFLIAISLQNLKIAEDIATELNNEAKWRTLGDLALKKFDLQLAERAYKNAEDLSSLLLLYSSLNDYNGLLSLKEKALSKGLYNIAFACSWLKKDISSCSDILSTTNRNFDAKLFNLTYSTEESS